MTSIGFRIAAAAFVLALAACGGAGTGDVIPGDGDDANVQVDFGDPGEAGDDGLDAGPDARDPGTKTDALDDGPAPDDGPTPDAADLPDNPPPADTPDPGDDPDADVPDPVDALDPGPEEVEACEGAWCTPCPDPIPCARYVRDAEGNCLPVVADNFCLVDVADPDTGLVQAQCFFSLQPSPVDMCRFCVPAANKYGFSPYASLPCDDGDPCTEGDTCTGQGSCLGGPPAICNDDNVCTNDSCTPMVGCIYTAIPQQSACDDHNACTVSDHCETGSCVGYALACSDTDPCTDKFCDPLQGCITTLNTAPCNDNDACTSGDTCTQGACKGVPVVCDDGDRCTRDSCAVGPLGGCVFSPIIGQACDDGNACTEKDFCGGDRVCRGYERDCDDGNLCTNDSCDPAVGCLHLPGAPLVCDDFDPCTIDDVCTGGLCVGGPNPCSDGNRCTRDLCDKNLGGCRWVPLGPTEACEDGDFCTVGETCGSGTCEGGQDLDCDDRNDCTIEFCDPKVGCVYQPQEGGICQPSDPCALFPTGQCQNGVCVTETRDCTDGNPCTQDSCDIFGECTHQFFTGPCDDDNQCTVGETCSLAGCGNGSQTNCDDGNACTYDTCDPKLGCRHTPNPGATACDDYSACTMNDRCNDGQCIGITVVCDDVNFCTTDACDPAVGCTFTPNTRACNDGNVCTVDDTCSAGACIGQSLFDNPAMKAGKLSFGISGNPGQGVNIDGNELTCAPKGSCVTGIDNSFGQLAWMFNPEMIKAVGSGAFSLLLENRDIETGGKVYTVNLFYGARVAPTSCDPATPGCNYRLLPLTLTGSCEPIYPFDNAKIVGTKLTAGGPTYTAPIYIVMGENQVPVYLRMATIVANVTLGGGMVVGGSGVIGGALPRQEILDAINAIPVDKFPPPYTRDVMLQYLNLYLKNDMDLDNDGIKEAVSMGLPFTIVTGNIIGPL